MKFIKGFSKMFSRPAAGTASKALSQAAADRSALKAGAKYIDIGSPPSNFNASGYLPKSAR